MDATSRVDLTDLTLFSRNGHRPALARLRAEDPVHWHGDGADSGFWAVARHRDALQVYADHKTFSSRQGMRLGTRPEAVRAVSQRMMIVSDPPVHTVLKRAVGARFGPSGMAGVRELVHRVINDVLDSALAEPEWDVVDVVKTIPNHVVCAIMGLPRADWEWIGALTTDAFESDNDEERSGAHAEIFLYFSDLLRQRRAHPGDDFISAIAEGRPGTRALDDEEIVYNCNGVLAGANETTRHAASGGVLAFLQHPDQWATVRRLGPGAVPIAVEEVLRWTTPGVHALRTATRDAVLGEVTIRAGDRVTVWNTSANDDEEVFTDPEHFDVTRKPNPHLTFGHGRHVCIGARLARLELAVFLEQLAERNIRLELAGEPLFTASNFTWGPRSLPVRILTNKEAS